MLERWTLQFTARGQQPAGRASDSTVASAAPVRLDTPAVYKRMVIALRSLYSYVRVLPAYRLHRACKVKRWHCHSRFVQAIAQSLGDYAHTIIASHSWGAKLKCECHLAGITGSLRCCLLGPG